MRPVAALVVASAVAALFARPGVGQARPGPPRPDRSGGAAIGQSKDRLWTERGAKIARRPSEAVALPSFSLVVRAIGPAVVNISTWQAADTESFRPKNAMRGLATGFLIHPSGYLLTNHHVVDGADDIRVRLADDREFVGHVVGSDERTDVALLKIEAPGALPVAPLGDSDGIAIGEWVVAVGNPFGLDHTVTAGIISGKGRHDLRPGAQAGFYDFLQTDASINVGNSGGPLVNTRGEVIGINTAMKAEAQGIAFAIPINMVKQLVPTLREHGRAARAWLGATTQPVTPSLMRALALPDLHGALVAEVGLDSPARTAGLAVGDVVLRFDGQTIRRADDLQWLIATAGAGHRATLAVWRAGRSFDAVAALVPDPDEPLGPPRQQPEPLHRSPLGMVVSEITPSIARELGQPGRRGVVVATVEPGSPASEAGLERGDLVVRIGEVEVKQLDDYSQAVRAIARGAMIPLLITRRDSRSRWVAFEKR